MTRLQGAITALITPFRGGKIDEKSLANLVDWQIKQGIHAVSACGTTGEAPTLTDDEYKRAVEITVETAAKRVPVIAGSGSNSTAATIEISQTAQKLGVDALLIVTPYYNKPTQEGMYQHYKAVHDATDLPIILYNVPARSIVDMNTETVARLAKLPRIRAIKDCSNDITRPVKTRLAAGPEFTQFTGDDPFLMPFLAQGGHGVISVTSNIAPNLVSDMYNAWKKGDMQTASALNDRLLPLHEAMFCETNPGPVKYAASLLGLCSEELRQPMWEISAANKQKVEAALQKAGLLTAAHGGQKTKGN